MNHFKSTLLTVTVLGLLSVSQSSMAEKSKKHHAKHARTAVHHVKPAPAATSNTNTSVSDKQDLSSAAGKGNPAEEQVLAQLKEDIAEVQKNCASDEKNESGKFKGMTCDQAITSIVTAAINAAPNRAVDIARAAVSTAPDKIEVITAAAVAAAPDKAEEITLAAADVGNSTASGFEERNAERGVLGERGGRGGERSNSEAVNGAQHRNENAGNNGIAVSRS